MSTYICRHVVLFYVVMSTWRLNVSGHVDMTTYFMSTCWDKLCRQVNKSMAGLCHRNFLLVIKYPVYWIQCNNMAKCQFRLSEHPITLIQISLSPADLMSPVSIITYTSCASCASCAHIGSLRVVWPGARQFTDVNTMVGRALVYKPTYLHHINHAEHVDSSH
jgi:hypothetical protein